MSREIDDSWLNHFYIYGEAYEALDLCALLDITLSRLVREGLLSEEDASSCKGNVSQVRDVVSKVIP